MDNSPQNTQRYFIVVKLSNKRTDAERFSDTVEIGTTLNKLCKGATGVSRSLVSDDKFMLTLYLETSKRAADMQRALSATLRNEDSFLIIETVSGCDIGGHGVNKIEPFLRGR